MSNNENENNQNNENNEKDPLVKIEQIYTKELIEDRKATKNESNKINIKRESNFKKNE